MVILVSVICSRAQSVSVHTYGVSQHGARCLPVDQMSDLACMFALVNCHIGDPFHGQLTAVKTRHPLTSITWLYCGLKCRTHREKNLSTDLKGEGKGWGWSGFNFESGDDTTDVLREFQRNSKSRSRLWFNCLSALNSVYLIVHTLAEFH